MIRPHDISTALWETINAAAAGDVPALDALLRRDSSLARASYFYTPTIHFAVREAHTEAVALLLDAGADPEWNGYHDGSLSSMARDRGYEAVARQLEAARERRGRSAPGSTLPVHDAAHRDDVRQLTQLLDDDPTLIDRGDAHGAAPLHRAVLNSARRAVALLLDRGANLHALLSTASGGGCGVWAADLQAIDLALFHRRDFKTARLLLDRGAACDLTIAAALGDLDRVQAFVRADPDALDLPRANGKLPLPTALEFGQRNIARWMLDRGAAVGEALHIAARAGDREFVELLLARRANPNDGVDSAGNAVFAASTPEIRALLVAHGGTLDPYDLVWMDQDDEALRIISADPAAAERGCGGVFTAVCTRNKKDLLRRLFAAGVQVPAVVTGCQTYLLENLELIPILLANGMNPSLPNWQNQTLLHKLCGGGPKEDNAETIARATLLLDAGAELSSRDDEYRSTPLAWAARTNMPRMAAFLLSRGAERQLPDDPPWATPRAWALRRGHREMASLLEEDPGR